MYVRVIPDSTFKSSAKTLAQLALGPWNEMHKAVVHLHDLDGSLPLRYAFTLTVGGAWRLGFSFCFSHARHG